MLIPLLLALAAVDGDTKFQLLKAAPKAATFAPTQKSWLPKSAQPFSPRFLEPPLLRPAATPAGNDRVPGEVSLVCGIRVYKPDPKFDAGIARKAPENFDKEMARTYVCPK